MKDESRPDENKGDFILKEKINVARVDGKKLK